MSNPLLPTPEQLSAHEASFDLRTKMLGRFDGYSKLFYSCPYDPQATEAAYAIEGAIRNGLTAGIPADMIKEIVDYALEMYQNTKPA